MEDRFEVFPDPLNNWIVWDRQKDAVAETGNQVLEFLSKDRARKLLCGAHRNPASAHKVSQGSWVANANLDSLEAIIASELASASLVASLVPALVIAVPCRREALVRFTKMPCSRSKSGRAGRPAGNESVKLRAKSSDRKNSSSQVSYRNISVMAARLS
jgi:hypothetical protein